MRGDVMQWIGRLVAIVFGLGVLAVLGAVVTLVRQAEGVPPIPIFLGLLGLAVLILLAGACLALISIASSARHGAEALQRLSAPQALAGPLTDDDEAPAPAAPESEMHGPFTPTGLHSPAAQTQRPSRRILVAER
jgi:hypothetical protein